MCVPLTQIGLLLLSKEETFINSHNHKNIYYVKNKDTILAIFCWKEFITGERPFLLENYGLPPYIGEHFEFWVKSRQPPTYRRNINALLQSLGLSSLKSILDVSLGLSLNDCLWVTSSPDLSWSSVNLFENPFNEVIAQIAFTGETENIKFSSPSPEFGTDGVLSKCWVWENGDIYLKKTETGKALTIYAEVLASQLLDYLKVPHASYSMGMYHDQICCSSKLLNSQDIMMVQSNIYFDFDTVDQLVEQMQNNGLLPEFANMMLADFIMKNQDRHSGNIGVLLDSDTFVLKGLAPLYDNGQSFFFTGTPALFNTWEEALHWALHYTTLSVPNLIDFYFDVSKVPGLSSSHVDKAYEVLAESQSTLKLVI